MATALAQSNILVAKSTAFISGCSLQALLQAAESEKEKCDLNNGRTSSKALLAIVNFAQRVDQFAQALDVYTQVTLNYAQIYDKISQTFILISENLERFERFRDIFASSRPMQESIMKLYNDIVTFTTRAARFYSSNRFFNLISCFWKDYDSRFGDVIADFQRHRKLVQDQAFIAYLEVDLEREKTTKDEILLGKLLKLRRWLSPPNHEPTYMTLEHESLRQQWCENTCSWLLPTLIDWKQSASSSVLWVQSPPGYGKSVLTAAVIEKMAELNRLSSESLQLAFYYCKSNDNGRRYNVEVAKSLLTQILNANLNNQTIIRSLMDICDSSTQPRAIQDSEQALWAILKQIIQLVSQKQVMLVVDGVDELFPDKQVDFVHNILSVLNYDYRLPVPVKLFLTSRSEPVLKVFDSHPSITLCILSSIQTISDIEIYTRNAVETSSTLRALDVGLRKDIISRLVNKSEGMFLWAKLMIHELEKQKSSSDIQRMLNRLPSGMKEAFSIIIGQMEEGCNGDIIFQYLTATFRPLTLPELTELLEMESEDRDYNPQQKLLIPVEEYVQQACRGLVTCNDGLVQFVHQSLKEYLCESRKLYYENSHSRMAAMTLTYGSFYRLNSQATSEATLNDRFRGFKQTYPFLEYSILNWCKHAKTSQVQGGLAMATVVVDALLRADHLTWMESRCFEECLSPNEVIACQLEVLQMRREFRGVSDQETIKTTLELGKLLQHHGRVKASQELFIRLLAEVKENSLSDNLQLATMKAIARSFERQNDWKQAEAQYRVCLDYSKQMEGSGNIEAVTLRNGLGWALKGQGKVKEAKEVYEQTYLKARESCALRDRDTLLAATELSYIYETEGSEEQAYQILKHELNATSCASGAPSNLQTKASLSLLEFFERRGRWDEAEALARNIFLRTQHSEVPCVDVAIKLTTFLEKKGNFQDAEDILLSVCSSLKAANLVRHRELLRVSLALADLYQRNNQCPKAEKVYDMSRTVLGHLGPETVLMIDCKLAECLEISQQLPEAQVLYETALKTSQETFGVGSRNSIDASNKLARFYQRTGKVEQALAVYNHVYDSCVETLGQDHRYTLDILTSIAEFYKSTGNREAASQSHMELLRMLTKTRGLQYHKALELMEDI
ncbi:hypothetical protein BP6252_14154 [Coleophoma cylindrospora]|uniref:NACHT domain-containing protein n=1 Tax=Coleophoma cylindrospora TaxID=1849047 RepID=A0A3D8Q3L1_9HELO|nr:hypothetical protein BP6252_14154 [Coleophoma cylindrospora]